MLCAALIAGSSILALRSVRASSEALVNTYSHELILAEKLRAAMEAKSSSLAV